MICPHCDTAFTYGSAEFEKSEIFRESGSPEILRQIYYGDCPECYDLIVALEETLVVDGVHVENKTEMLFPKFTERSVEPEVPADYTEDFIEAASVLNHSPKASAALSRRLLQHILREHFKIEHHSLAKEIDDFLKLKDIPSYLRSAIDAIRNIGNFAAHPLKDDSTGTIVDVEPGEAEWLLEVLESLFDFAFVQPRRLAAKQAALNVKLKALGKPPMK